MLRMIAIPLILAIASAAAVYYGREKFSLSNVEMVLIATGLFCLLMVLHNHFVASLTIMRARQAIRTLNGFERELLRKIEELRSRKADLSEITALTERLDELEVFREKAQLAIAAGETRPEAGTDTEASDDQPRFAEAGNVVDLSRRKNTGGDAIALEKGRQNRAGHAIASGETSLMLQPIVQLPEQNPKGLEAFCAVEETDPETGEKTLVPVTSGLSPRARGLAERETLNHVAKAIRIMARNGQLMQVFLPITKATLSKTNLTKEIYRTIKNDPKLVSNLVFQFPLGDVSKLKGEDRENFFQLMELGVPFCVSECNNVDDTLRAVRSGYYKYIKMDAALLLSFGKREGELVSGQILPDCEQIGVSIIGTNIVDSNVAAELIDNDILLAQGELFSPPRPARTDERRLARSEKAAGK